MSKAYTKQVLWLFEVDDEQFAAERKEEDYIRVEEVRKNGQEDSHMSGDVVMENGQWVYESEQISFNGGDALAVKVLAYINKHGAPPIETAPL